MHTVEKFIAGAFGLIFVYLLVANAKESDTVIKALGSFNTGWIKALQGR